MKNRWFSIIMYILSFVLLFFITSVVIINAFYSIPYQTNGVDFSRSFTLVHDIVFGIIAFIFALLGSYCFLSVFGKKTIKEVFTRERRKIVYISCIFAFGIVYFLTELLVGYIVLNINDPNAFINGSNGGNIVINEDKTLNNVYINSNINNTNIVSIDGNHTLNVNDSNLINYGSNVLSDRGLNTIVVERNGASFNGDRVMLTLTGANSEVAYVDNSAYRLFNSNVSIDDKTSMFIYGNKAEVYTNSTSISSSSETPIVLRNGSTVFLERTSFVSKDNCKNVITISSDDSELVNTINIKNGSIDKGDYNIFSIDSATTVINLSDLKIDWIDIEKYIADIKNSNVTINISNSMVTGRINFDDYSNLKLNIEKSQFNGFIFGNKGFELTMDDNSVLTSPGSVHLSKFNGSELALRKVISIQNSVILDTEN